MGFGPQSHWIQPVDVLLWRTLAATSPPAAAETRRNTGQDLAPARPHLIQGELLQPEKLAYTWSKFLEHNYLTWKATDDSF